MIEAMPPAQLVELINEWGTVPRVAAGEQEQPFPPREGLAPGVPDNLVRELRDESIQRVADRLHPVFTASTPAECAELVTEILTATEVYPVVGVIDDRAGAGWAIDAPSNALAAAAGLTLREHLGKHGFTRLGVCTGRNCADVYIDASPTRDRRYCSLTCQNRARAAAFRSRHHAPKTTTRS
ncbi:CGNR zinc finger domain-containing protein [Streptomyces sp. NBC_01727]|uniref:CGNR zinc finger domain-containing protein n=1 Tax=Streptomyces sp. NBC_01727 TaxID=2975924 RepID=UPI002E0E7618|nr:CGNR zinc finger domain-containing protein [Streptomyces sp. NBC_01727]